MQKVVDQACIIDTDLGKDILAPKHPELIANFPEVDKDHDDYFQAHTCRHGNTTDFLSLDAAVVPRELPHILRPQIEQESQFFGGDKHGSNVGQVVIGNASDTKIIMVNTDVYGSRYSNPTKTSCGVHNWKDSSCYRLKGDFDEIFNWLSNKSNLNVVNLSLTDLSRDCNFASASIKKVRDKGIALIAGAGNREKDENGEYTNDKKIGWPACNPLVFTVGALDLSDAIEDYSRTGESNFETVDFYASGNMQDYETGDIVMGTSISTPPCSSIFCIN